MPRPAQPQPRAPRRSLKASELEQACRAQGLRMTGQRLTILRVLAGAGDHPDVVELHRRVIETDPQIALSTVYRTLRLLNDKGLLARHAFRDGLSRYESADAEHHDHLINVRTGQVIEFRSEEIERLQAEVARRLGFRLVDHRLELYAVPLDDDTP